MRGGNRDTGENQCFPQHTEPVYQQKPGIQPLPNTLYPALSPNRRRMLPLRHISKIPERFPITESLRDFAVIGAAELSEDTPYETP